jgi:hypothetical protein
MWGRTAHNYELVNALAATGCPGLPGCLCHRRAGPEDNLGNSVLYATMQPIPAEDHRPGSVTFQHAACGIRNFASEAMTRLNIVKSTPDTLIFTDDRAPVEMVIHRIIFDFLARG